MIITPVAVQDVPVGGIWRTKNIYYRNCARCGITFRVHPSRKTATPRTHCVDCRYYLRMEPDDEW